MKKKYDTATPYIASYIILRSEGKLAFVLRSHTGWMNGYYGLPSGKVEKGETYIQAAVREAKEEAGVDVKVSDLRQVLTMHRKDHQYPDNNWIDVYFEALKWEGEPRNAEPDIHGELVWHSLDDLPENVIPSVKAALQHIEAGTNYAEFGWDT